VFHPGKFCHRDRVSLSFGSFSFPPAGVRMRGCLRRLRAYPLGEGFPAESILPQSSPDSNWRSDSLVLQHAKKCTFLYRNPEFSVARYRESSTPALLRCRLVHTSLPFLEEESLRCNSQNAARDQIHRAWAPWSGISDGLFTLLTTLLIIPGNECVNFLFNTPQQQQLCRGEAAP